jgi:hypothetical protein
VVTAWSGTRFAIIESGEVFGDGSAWIALGALAIVEGLILAILAWEKRIRRMGRGLVYAIAFGVFAGALAAAAVHDTSAINWFGGELAYALIAASIGAVACVISWSSGSGVFGVVIGAVGGFVSSLLIALIATFLLWATGYSFPGQDAIIGGGLNVIGTGFFGGVAGGIAGLVLDRFHVSP